MMSLQQAFARLDVAPDADARIIRRAYADGLRGIDPDSDPAGFAALREARDTALAAARARAAGEVLPLDDGLAEDVASGEDDDPDNLLDDAGPVVIRAPMMRSGAALEHMSDGWAAARDAEHDGEDGAARDQDVAEQAPAGPDIAAEPTSADDEADGTDYAAHAHALSAILAPDAPAGPYLDAEVAAQARAHLEVLLTDPRLDLLDTRGWAEQWYADLLAGAGTRGDPVLDQLVAFFGWQHGRGRFDQPPAVAAAVDRAADLAFMRELAVPGHRFHRAWRMMTGQTTGLRNLAIRPKRARELLATIRRDHPGVEQYLVPARVSHWDHGGSSGSLRTIGFAIALVILFARLVVTLAPDEPRPSPTPLAAQADPVLSSAAADINPVLDRIGGHRLSLAALEKANPAYYRALMEQWNVAAVKGTRQLALARDVEEDARKRYYAAFDRADAGPVRAARQYQLDRLTYIREQRGGVVCGDLVLGKGSPEPPVDYQPARQHGMMADLLLTSTAGPSAAPSPGALYTIPGKVLADAAKIADLPAKRFGDALRGKSGSARACNAHIALLSTVLALPADEGLKLLRAM